MKDRLPIALQWPRRSTSRRNEVNEAALHMWEQYSKEEFKFLSCERRRKKKKIERFLGF